MSNSEWRPKVGERVAIYGTIERDDQSTLPFKVRFDGFEGDNDYTWAKISEVAPLAAANPAAVLSLLDEVERLREAAFRALNYIENTESELGIKLGCGDALRAVLEPRA